MARELTTSAERAGTSEPVVVHIGVQFRITERPAARREEAEDCLDVPRVVGTARR